MNSIIGLGKYLFAIPFIVFGIFHFMNANEMAGMAFNSSLLVYLVGVALVAAGISTIIGKMDRLANLLLALLLILFVILVHAPGLGNEETMQMSMSGMLKDIALAGGALMAASQAKDV